MNSIYVAGPITGRDYEEAKAHFEAASEYCLTVLKMHPVNPMKLVHNHDKSWLNYMRVGIRAMMECDAVYALCGFENSKGALAEIQLAVNLEIPIYLEKQLPIGNLILTY